MPIVFITAFIFGVVDNGGLSMLSVYSTLNITIRYVGNQQSCDPAPGWQTMLPGQFTTWRGEARLS